AMAHDLSLFPQQASLVGQSYGIGSQQLTLAAIIDKSMAEMNALLPDDRPAKLPNRKEMEVSTTKQLLTLIERVGDIRLDAVSFAMSYKKDDDAWAILSVRGKYDSAVVFNEIKAS